VGNIYNPDKWVLLKINGDKPFYKVFATWYGGYTQGDYWRFNSGITSVKVGGNYYEFYGETGSCYQVNRDSYGLSGYTSGVLNNFIERADGAIELLDKPADLINFEW